MSASLVARLDALQGWRAEALARVETVERLLTAQDLLDAGAAGRFEALRQRLSADRRRVAIVGEFSRGKSELINALLHAGDATRILPATPGRTTMCPVEIAYAAGTRPSVALLPIETRCDGATLAELRDQPALWTRMEFDEGDAAGLAAALAQVAGTRPASVEEARLLGLWDDANPQGQAPVDARGEVEIPRWRHALVNHRHPLLLRGLSVLDTPGLNALGAEPELTLGLLPAAHAIVFVLGADTGVTRSDLELWRDHLASRPVVKFVVLNKIDTLRDPLLDPAEVTRQIEAQRRSVAHTLGIDPAQVFAVSARDALVAALGGALAGKGGQWGTGMPELEAALGARLLEDGRAFMRRQVDEALAGLRVAASHRLGERRRQLAEQTLELRGLRGKSGSRLRAANLRVATDAREFEQCQVQIQALRAVHKRLYAQAQAPLAGEALRERIERLQREWRPALFKLAARPAFGALCADLRASLAQAQSRAREIHAMLAAGCARLNAEYGFAISLAPCAVLDRHLDDLNLIETGYEQFLGLAGAVRLLQPRFMEQFKRMLMSKLRVVFESAASDLELWSRAALAQIDTQLAERRSAFARRAASIERVERAAGELEQRLAELAAQDAELQQAQRRLVAVFDEPPADVGSAGQEPSARGRLLAAGT